MKIAMIGGTFNPPHNGHLRLGRTILERLGYEAVVFVPAFVPPHKEVAGGISAAHRLEMTRLAAAGLDRALVEDVEILRGGVSWTIETIGFLSSKYSCSRPGLVVGDDHVPIFHTWREPDRLSKEASIIVVNRSGRGGAAGFGWEHTWLDLEPDGISSGEIRRLLAKGDMGTVRELVPAPVFDYIRNEGLYRNDRS
jgi:nicotinate-nucleotide adenylyltransferase